MTTFEVRCFEAWPEGSYPTDFEHRPFRFEPWWEEDRPIGSLPKLELVTTLTVDATDPEHAAELVYVIGNRMDDSRKEWPATRRSMSVGDVVVIDGDVALGCDRAGWTRVALISEQMQEGARA